MSKIIKIKDINQVNLLLTLPKTKKTYFQGIAKQIILPINQMEFWELIQGLSPKNQHMIFKGYMLKIFD